MGGGNSCRNGSCGNRVPAYAPLVPNYRPSYAPGGYSIPATPNGWGTGYRGPAYRVPEQNPFYE